jgi:hypothetical protein
VTPTTLNLGGVQSGCITRSQEIRITNACAQTAHLDSVQLAGSSPACPGSTCAFTVSLPRGTVDLAAGQTLPLSVTYHPAQASQDFLTLNVTEVGLSPIQVTLTGSGLPIAATQTDTFNPRPNKVDVLLVVDDSASMSDKQAALANNFNAFIQPALTSGVDFRLAVTTTSTRADSVTNCPPGSFGNVAGCGTFNGAVLTPQTPNLQQAFATEVNVGTNGSGTEKGLEGAFEAVSPLILNSGVNAPFLRDDARLAVVAVSDASDQSTGAVATYLNYFYALKTLAPAPGFILSAVTSTSQNSPSATCAYDGTNTSPNPYIDAAHFTGGAVGEICSATFAQVMTDVGLATFQPPDFLTGVDLSQQADPAGAFTVTVDGAALPGPAATDGGTWQYDPATNTVRLSPPVGSNRTVAVTYTLACAPAPLLLPDGGLR